METIIRKPTVQWEKGNSKQPAIKYPNKPILKANYYCIKMHINEFCF